MEADDSLHQAERDVGHQHHRGFADRCHHAKEEDVLFPALRQALPSESQAVLRDLTHDHERGRALVGAIESYAKPACAGDARSIAGFETAVAAYARLLEQHIEREDLQLVTLADRLPPAVKTQVEEGFERVELAATGKGGHARYEHAIDDLAKRYSRYARRSAAA